MRTELRTHPSAQLYCSGISASLGPIQEMGKGHGQTPLLPSSLQQLLPQFSHSHCDLEGGFVRGCLVLWCVHGEEFILYFHTSQVIGRLGEGHEALASIRGAALVL